MFLYPFTNQIVIALALIINASFCMTNENEDNLAISFNQNMIEPNRETVEQCLQLGYGLFRDWGVSNLKSLQNSKEIIANLFAGHHANSNILKFDNVHLKDTVDRYSAICSDLIYNQLNYAKLQQEQNYNSKQTILAHHDDNATIEKTSDQRLVDKTDDPVKDSKSFNQQPKLVIKPKKSPVYNSMQMSSSKPQSNSRIGENKENVSINLNSQNSILYPAIIIEY